MSRLFGTDGVRGVANKELTASLAFEIGRAAAFVLGTQSSRPVFVIGRDTRVSGDMLDNAIASGILSVGGNVIKLGVIPTPAVAYLVKHYDADAGIVISASHNPFEYNGIKIFNGDGFKLDDRIEEKIEDIILQYEFRHPECTGECLGRCLDAGEDAVKVYTDFLLSTMDMRLDGIKVVLDTANGAAYQTAKIVYESLGADVTLIGDEPNGVNINEGFGSTHPQKLQKAVRDNRATVGFAFDGDADRLIAVDEKGRILDGDYLLCICGRALENEDLLFGDRITATVMSNIGLHRFCRKNGIEVDVTDVGDRYVLESMLKSGSVLGGEQSGHMIFLNYTTTGDGVLSSLQFMRAYLRSGKAVSALRDSVAIYPQALVNAVINPEYRFDALNDPEVLERIGEVEEKVGSSGRVLIRPSGTEPMIRVMIEGKDTEVIRLYAEYIAELITEKFGADK